GGGRLCCRVSFPGAWHHSTGPPRGGDHRGSALELHQHPQYHLSAPGCHPGDSLYPDRWHPDAAHDEYARASNVSPSWVKIVLLSVPWQTMRWFGAAVRKRNEV